MGGNNHAVRAMIGDNFNKRFSVHAQNWTTIGAQVAQAGKLLVDFINRVKVWSEKEDVNFPYLSLFRIDKAYFCGEDKGDILGGRMERFQVFIIRGNDIFQTEEAVSLRLQFLLEQK